MRSEGSELMGEGCDGRVMRWAPSPNKVTSSVAFSLEAKHKTAGWGLGVYHLPGGKWNTNSKL